LFTYFYFCSSLIISYIHYEESSVPGAEKEAYFFCKRGRKYKNSIRPNRVTGSGFWKATGIDKPIYSNGGEGNNCVGLKKTLVYYRGSAGKGTKTDWMMHEFRLPSKIIDANTNLPYAKTIDVDNAHEAVSNLHNFYKFFIIQSSHIFHFFLEHIHYLLK
jgi:hypothetical protein